jgi:dTDP-4-dehydrorhamnose reductase
MKVFVTGGAGQLGSLFCPRAEAAGWQVVSPNRAELDCSRREATLNAVIAERPDVLVHLAAFTNVDRCELEPDLAMLHNAFAVRNVAEAAQRVGAHLVTLSTDYVFDGELGRPYTEWDTPNPQSVYGVSKLGGEREALQASSDGTKSLGSSIVRTSWLCGPTGNNIMRTILRAASDGDRILRFVDDQRGCPTFAPDLADALVTLVRSRQAGTFHVTNGHVVSWFEFARDIVAAAGLDPARVEPIATADLEPRRPAPRPANSALEGLAWQAAGFSRLPEYGERLKSMVSAALSVS